MSRFTQAFTQGKAFIPFITAGDPDLATTEQLVLAMAKAGADMIEIGIPFSDPIAEGPVIQAADVRALNEGTTLDGIFAMVQRIREKTAIPLCFMTYINPIYTYGADRFLQACQKVGIDGVIVPDLPYEEKEEILPFCKKYDVTLISLIAPTSKERIAKIAKEAEGFLYCVSSMGVTGMRKAITTDIGEMIRQVKQVNNIPCAIGFGISTPLQAKEMAAHADGVIVGSAIVDLVARYGKDSVAPVTAFVREMKNTIRSTT